MENLDDIYSDVKAKIWTESIVSLFVVKRTLSNKVAKYNVLHVNADDNLRIKLRISSSAAIQNSNAAKAYDFIAGDLDGDVLSLGVEETDFSQIVDCLAGEIEDIEGIDDLVKTWLYIVRLDLNEEGGQPLYAIRKVSDTWSTKKVQQTFANMIYENNVLMDLDRKEIFQIDGKIDFYVYDGAIFVVDKRNFENAMNFRAGMEKNRDAIVLEFDELGIFDDPEKIKNAVGSNLKWLRKLSQVKNSNYYNNPDFMSRLKLVVQEENWNIQYNDNDEIVVDEENIDLLLTVLNNDRLTSKTNDEDFDVDIKHKLQL